MRIHSGILELSRLYQYVRGQLGELKFLDGRGPEGRSYKKMVVELCSEVPREGGFYLWGRQTECGWQSIYVGLAEKRKTACLNDRLIKELDCEKIFLPAHAQFALDQNILLGSAKSHYKNRRLDNHFARGAKKAGTAYILWAAVPELTGRESYRAIEAALIKEFQPTANTQRPRTWAEPPEASLVKAEFEKLIGFVPQMV